MQYRLIGALLAALCGSAAAANVPSQMLAANTQACVQLAGMMSQKGMDPYAPKDKSKQPAYCGCVSKKYWDQVPQADYDGMMAEMTRGEQHGPRGQAIDKALNQRMENAKKACRG